MANRPSVDFTVRVVDEDWVILPNPKRGGRYTEIVDAVLADRQDRIISCGTPKAAHAVYVGIRRAIMKRGRRVDISNLSVTKVDRRVLVQYINEHLSEQHDPSLTSTGVPTHE